MTKLKRKPNRREILASCVIVADLHLTESAPVARIDNYIAAQEKKLAFLQELSEENESCPVLCAGDVFDYWKTSPWLAAWAYRNLPNNFICIPGNHDLPLHSFLQYEKSALHLLDTVGEFEGKITVLKEEQFAEWDICIHGCPFGEVENVNFRLTPESAKNRNILLMHELTFEKTRPPWAPQAWTSEELLDKFSSYFDLIVVGDNHQTFMKEKNGAILVSPGSMMRMTAAQEMFEPSCFLYYAETNELEKVPFPIQKEKVFDITYLETKKEKDDRIEAYIEKLKQDYEISISFRDNLTAFFAENKINKKVREIIWQHLEMNRN